MRFRFASNKDTKDFSKIFSLTVNGKEVAIASKPFATNDGWFGYKMTDVLARIVLEPGENVIVLTALGGGDANLDSVVLTASAELVLTACKMRLYRSRRARTGVMSLVRMILWRLLPR